MHRETMIDLLVLDCFEKVANSRRGTWLLTILRDGFVGFGKMSDAQLADEFTRRGLLAQEETAAGHDDWQGADGIDEWQVSQAVTGRWTEGCEY